MQRKDIDELIEIIKEESEEKLMKFANKNGINYIKGENTVNECLMQLCAKIREDEDIDTYFKIKVKLVELSGDLSEEGNLEEILKCAERYGLDASDILFIVTNVDSKYFIKKLINIERDGIDRNYILNIAQLVNDNKFTKKVICNAEKYGLNKDEILKLIRNTNSQELTEDVISNPKAYGLEKKHVLKIVGRTLNGKLREKVIDNIEEYGFNSGDIVDILGWSYDKKLIEKVINNAKEYGLDAIKVFDIARNTQDEEMIKKALYNIKPSEYYYVINYVGNYRRYFADLDFIKDNLEVFCKIENIAEKEKIILDMYEKNNEILRVNHYLFDDRIIDALGLEKINQISCYMEIQDSIIKLNDCQLKLFGKSVDFFIKETQSTDWTYLAERILRNIESYQELSDEVEKRDDIDLEKITSIIIHPNKFNIKKIDDVKNYDKIKQKKCQELINSDNLSDKIEGVFQKIFNIGTEEAKKEIEKFGQDIELIQDEELKTYIKGIKKIIELESPELLEELFNNVMSVEKINPIIIEKKLKKEYCKMYNEGLFNIEDAKKIEGQSNMYDAGTDFKMIITSVAPFVKNQPENYYKDWNRPSIDSQHFCTSYIRNDMMGHTEVPHICYGFAKMSEDSLVLSGSKDISSSDMEFVSIAYCNERYLSPDRQINETIVYNEMDFKRIQNGEKKQPDYIVVFRKNGEIDNIEKALKASEEFGELPIVVIDVDKCLEVEKQKVNELQKEYKETKKPVKAQELYQKIRNNRVTDASFCEEINLEQLYKATQEEEKVQCKDLEVIYSKIDATERKKESEKLKNMYRQITNILEKGKYDER